MTSPSDDKFWAPVSPYEGTPFEGLPFRAEQSPFFAQLLMVGGAVVLGVGGVLGVVGQLLKKKEGPPATTSQKVVRLGLLGGLVGTGAYLYAFGRHPATPVSRGRTPSFTPPPRPTASTRGTYQ